MPINEIAYNLFVKVEGLQYINFYVAETYKLYIQGNIIISHEIEEYIRENILPVAYELKVNEKPYGLFESAGIIAIKNGEMQSCLMRM